MLTKVKTTSKKAFSVLLAFVMCFTAFAVCMPVIADAIAINGFVYGRYYYYPQGTQFISSIRYGQDDKGDDARGEAQQDGHTLLSTDLNSGVSGKDYIFLGYKTSTNINDAMATHFRNGHTNSDVDSKTFSVNGKILNFTRTGINTSGKQNLNADAGGDYIYLFATKDAQAGLPVTAIAASALGDAGAVPPAGYHVVTRDDDGSASDCNADAGGDYVYLYFDNTTAYTDVTNQMLRLLDGIQTAESLGGASCYTPETWAAVGPALAEAKRVASAYDNAYHAGTITAAEITAAAQALEKAMAALVTIITIDANGGETAETSYSTVTSGKTTVSFPAKNYTAKKEGHKFLGWSTDKNATTGSKTTLYNVPVGGTVYAIFSINTFTVNFVDSVTKTTIKTETVNYGSDATAPEVETFIKNSVDNHYKFVKWDKAFSNIKENVTVNTVYELVGHSYELTSETAANCIKEGSKVYTCKDCGQVKTETSPINHENHVNVTQYEARESTCNVPGFTAYTYCNDCNKVVAGREPLPLAEHTWGEWSESTATCTKSGTSTRKCPVCNSTETKTVPATGHNWSDWTVVKDATCTAPGREQRNCLSCPEVETKVIDPAGHKYEAVVTAPTCTELGYTTHTCSECDDSYVDTYVSALGHDWENVGDPTVKPTCTTTGKQNQECSRCEATQEKILDSLGHNWVDEKITKEPTCTTDGSMSATCDRCGDVQHEIIIPAPGHDWDEGTVTVEPTCTTAGNLHKTCEACGEERDIVLDALGHAWGDGVVMIEPSCSKEGEKYFVCSVCYDVKTEVIEKLPHAYKGVVTFPTCTEDGYTTYTCDDCGDVLVDDVVSATGHMNLVTVVPPTCTIQGYTVTRCLICDDISRTDYVDAKGHNYEESSVLPTCHDKGYTLVKCHACGDSSRKDFVDALGHEYEASTVAPTCVQKGYDLHTCIRGDHSYKDNYVDATGHNHLEDSRVEPTRTQNGYILYVCDVCSNEMKEILYFDGKALIYITLYDTEGNIIPNATINFTEVNTGKTFTLKTDLNGYFTEVLPEGEYDLVIKANGIKETKGHISVYGGTATIEIPEIPVVECDCYCHKSDFISAIRRIFAKILSIFGVKHECCDHSAV